MLRKFSRIIQNIFDNKKTAPRVRTLANRRH
jgi:hypothetical protein